MAREDVKALEKAYEEVCSIVDSEPSNSIARIVKHLYEKERSRAKAEKEASNLRRSQRLTQRPQ